MIDHILFICFYSLFPFFPLVLLLLLIHLVIPLTEHVYYPISWKMPYKRR